MQNARKNTRHTARDHCTHWMVAGAILAAAYTRSGRLDLARRATAAPLRATRQPRLSSAKEWMQRLRRPNEIGRYAAADRLAGIPE